MRNFLNANGQIYEKKYIVIEVNRFSKFITKAFSEFIFKVMHKNSLA